MSEKSQIKEKIEKLTQVLRIHNHYYHVLDKPTINDAEYDLLFKELEELEKAYPELAVAESSTRKVGSTSDNLDFVKVHHEKKMLSLDNAMNQEEFQAFLTRASKRLGTNYQIDELDFCCELKLDGLAMSLTYKDGKLVQALTRGDGEVGEDVTANIRHINNVPLTLTGDYPPELAVRGEVIMTISGLQALNNKLEALGEETYANVRNAAASSTKLKKSEIVAQRPLLFYAYSYFQDEQQELQFNSQYDSLKYLETLGFSVNEHMERLKGIANLEQYFAKISELREQLDYEIDGTVFKIDRIDLQNRFRDPIRAPGWAIAYKFPPKEAITELLNVDWQVGRTGILTPLARIKPVKVGGVLVSNISLHNVSNINLLNLQQQDTISVYRAGEVIPQLKRVILELRSKDSKLISYPKYCPSCKHKLELISNSENSTQSTTVKHYNYKAKVANRIKSSQLNLKLYKFPQVSYGSYLSFSHFQVSKLTIYPKVKYQLAATSQLLSLLNSELMLIESKNINPLTNTNTLKGLNNLKKLEELFTTSQLNKLFVQRTITNLTVKDKTNKLLSNYLKIADLNSSSRPKTLGIFAKKYIAISGAIKVADLTLTPEQVYGLIKLFAGIAEPQVEHDSDYLLIGDNPDPQQVELAQLYGIHIIESKILEQQIFKLLSLENLEEISFLYCSTRDSNSRYSCDAINKEKLNYFFSKKAIYIKGTSVETLNKLYDAGLINNYADLLRANKKDLAQFNRIYQNRFYSKYATPIGGRRVRLSSLQKALPQLQAKSIKLKASNLKKYQKLVKPNRIFGDKTLEQISSEIVKARNSTFERYLIALGIEGIGTINAKELVRRFKSFEALSKASIEDIQMLQDFDKIAHVIYQEVTSNRLQELYRLSGLNLQQSQNRFVKQSRFTGEHLFLDLKKWNYFPDQDGEVREVSREEFKDKFKKTDAIIEKKLNNNTKFVITQLENVEYSYPLFQEAIKLNLKIITPYDFLSLTSLPDLTKVYFINLDQGIQNVKGQVKKHLDKLGASAVNNLSEAQLVVYNPQLEIADYLLTKYQATTYPQLLKGNNQVRIDSLNKADYLTAKNYLESLNLEVIAELTNSTQQVYNPRNELCKQVQLGLQTSPVIELTNFMLFLSDFKEQAIKLYLGDLTEQQAQDLIIHAQSLKITIELVDPQLADFYLYSISNLATISSDLIRLQATEQQVAIIDFDTFINSSNLTELLTKQITISGDKHLVYQGKLYPSPSAWLELLQTIAGSQGTTFKPQQLNYLFTNNTQLVVEITQGLVDCKYQDYTIVASQQELLEIIEDKKPLIKQPTQEIDYDLIDPAELFTNVNYVITGAFKDYGFQKKDIEKILARFDATQQSNVDLTTQLLISNKADSKKHKDAEKLNIRIIDANNFMKIVNRLEQLNEQ